MKRFWLPALALAVLAMAGLMYEFRLNLLHYYFSLTDSHYTQDVTFEPYAFPDQSYAPVIFLKSACNGRTDRLGTMLAAGFVEKHGEIDRGMKCAALAGHWETVAYLLDNGGRLNDDGTLSSCRTSPATLLEIAVAKQNRPLVEQLAKAGATIQFLEANGTVLQGPLHFAAFNRDPALIAFLVESGASPSLGPMTPMAAFLSGERIAEKDRTAETWTAALGAGERAGLDASSLDNTGGSLLHWAASKGEVALIEVLLIRGFDPLLRDKGGAYPFMRLAEWMDQSVIPKRPEELESALRALARNVPDLAAEVRLHWMERDECLVDTEWRLAEVAANNRQLRQMFGDKIDFSVLEGGREGSRWAVRSVREMHELVDDLTAQQLHDYRDLYKHMLKQQTFPYTKVDDKIRKAGLAR